MDFVSGPDESQVRPTFLVKPNRQSHPGGSNRFTTQGEHFRICPLDPPSLSPSLQAQSSANLGWNINRFHSHTRTWTQMCSLEAPSFPAANTSQLSCSCCSRVKLYKRRRSGQNIIMGQNWDGEKECEWVKARERERERELLFPQRERLRIRMSRWWIWRALDGTSAGRHKCHNAHTSQISLSLSDTVPLSYSISLITKWIQGAALIRRHASPAQQTAGRQEAAAAWLESQDGFNAR